MKDEPGRPPGVETPAGRTSAPQTAIDVRSLLGGRKEIVLRLDDQDYRLRVTASGKLILTK